LLYRYILILINISINVSEAAVALWLS
jgi:hypothetical protein